MYTTQRIKKDKHKRLLFSKRMVLNLVHKVVCHDRTYESTNMSDWHTYRKRARIFHHSPQNAINTQIKNRCILSGRSKGVYRFCKLSRIQMRELAGKGLLTGIVKASW